MEPVDAERNDLRAVSVVREAFRIFAVEWKRFLSWAVLPLAASIVMLVLVHPDPSKQDEGLLGAWGNLLGFVAMWLWVPFSIRVYRLVILGELPKAGYVRQLFQPRAWRYVGKSTLAYVQYSFIMSPIMAIFMAILIPLADRPGYGGNTQSLFFSPYYLGLLCVAQLLGFLPMAKRLAFVGPDIAVDGVGSLSRLGRRAGPHYWLIIRTVVLVWGIPLVLSEAWQLIVLARMAENTLVLRLAAVCDLMVSTGFAFVARVAIGLLYKRLSPSWPAQDAAEEEVSKKGHQRYTAELAASLQTQSTPANTEPGLRDSSHG